jgi:hypothetical protein
MSTWHDPNAAETWDFPGDRPQRRRHPSWLIPGLLALVIFELTSDPALTVVVGCLKFGWDALATARWLRRTDPDRMRGRICARFYAAWALWRVSLVAVAMMFLLVIVVSVIEGQRKPNGGPVGPPAGFMGACLTAMFGFLLSAWISNLAVVTAWRRGIRVWLGPEANRARRIGIWPPTMATGDRFGENRAHAIVLSALVTDMVVVGMIALLVALAQAPRRPGGPDVPPVVVITLVMAVSIAPPVLILTLRDSIRARVIATSPFECWPEDEGTDHAA